MNATVHMHVVLHEPKTLDKTGVGTCECGATVRVEQGKPVGDWHACELCVHAEYLSTVKKP